MNVFWLADEDGIETITIEKKEESSDDDDDDDEDIDMEDLPDLEDVDVTDIIIEEAGKQQVKQNQTQVRIDIPLNVVFNTASFICVSHHPDW